MSAAAGTLRCEDIWAPSPPSPPLKRQKSFVILTRMFSFLPSQLGVIASQFLKVIIALAAWSFAARKPFWLFLSVGLTNLTSEGCRLWLWRPLRKHQSQSWTWPLPGRFEFAARFGDRLCPAHTMELFCVGPAISLADAPRLLLDGATASFSLADTKEGLGHS